jgi:hypothetical protein
MSRASLGGATRDQSATQAASNQPAVRQIPQNDPARVSDPATLASVDANAPRLETPSREAIVTAYHTALQSQAPAARTGNEAEQGGSKKVRDRDNASQSATQAAPPRRSHPARPALGTLTEQGVVTECEHHGYRRDRADPDACNRASEETWRNPFPGATPPPGATQGISTTDRPSSGFPER